MRRLLFPHNGEDTLSRKQGLRIILTWGVAFPLLLSLSILLIAFLISLIWYKAVELFLLSFLSGVVIFGLLGLIVVNMNNRAVRVRQDWMARKAQK